MSTLWFKLGGLLHNGTSLYACEVCPCPDQSSSSSSSFSDSGSSVASDSCTSSTCVEVPCCPGVQIPTTLFATFTGGNCAGTYTMVWDGRGWFSEDFPNGLLEMSCDTFGWYLQIVFNAYGTTTESCNPFQLYFEIDSHPVCGTFTITITG